MSKEKDIKEIFDTALQNHKKNNFKIAEQLYKKILATEPNHFESTVLLGTLSAQTKNFFLAKQLLEKAIKINPNYAEAYYNLGLVLNELKDFKNAIGQYEKAIKINPNYLDAYNNLGNSYKELGEFDKAISFYEKVIVINPNYASAHNNLGVVFKKIEKYEKAIKCYNEAIKLMPDHIDAHYNLGLAYDELGEDSKAITCYEKAIQINPDYADAYNNLGNSHRDLGELEKAATFYEKAIARNPENLAYYYALGQINKKIFISELKDKVEKIIKNNKSTDRNMAFGNYLLAKYESEKKNYEKELDYLIEGHSYYFKFKKEKFKRQTNYWFDILPNINKSIEFNGSNENEYQPKPIFIVGVPRCGSTLVEKIIASGSKYIPIGEETSILDKLIKYEIQEKKLLNLNRKNFLIDALKKYKQKGLIQEKSDFTFTDKSLENFFYIQLIKEIFPNAKVINLKRKPLSSIMSILKNNLTEVPWAHDLENIFRYFDIYYREINHFEKIFPNFIYNLHYEQFVNDPEKESKKLLEFCNLEWDKKCLEFYKRKDLISKTASNAQIREAIYKHSTEKYLPYKIFLNRFSEKYSWF